MVHKQIEELVLGPGVERAVDGPEEELVGSQWETASEEVARSLFHWDSEERLGWGGVVPPQFDWPCLISVVGSSSVLEWSGEPACWEEGDVRSDQVFERVVVTIFLWRPGASVDVLPESQLDG